MSESLDSLEEEIESRNDRWVPKWSKEKQKAWEEREKKTNLASKEIGKLLLQGWTMLGEHCENCGSTLMRKKDETICPYCIKYGEKPSNNSDDEEKQSRPDPKLDPIMENDNIDVEKNKINEKNTDNNCNNNNNVNPKNSQESFSSRSKEYEQRLFDEFKKSLLENVRNDNNKFSSNKNNSRFLAPPSSNASNRNNERQLSVGSQEPSTFSLRVNYDINELNDRNLDDIPSVFNPKKKSEQIKENKTPNIGLNGPYHKKKSSKQFGQENLVSQDNTMDNENNPPPYNPYYRSYQYAPHQQYPQRPFSPYYPPPAYHYYQVPPPQFNQWPQYQPPHPMAPPIPNENENTNISRLNLDNKSDSNDNINNDIEDVIDPWLERVDRTLGSSLKLVIERMDNLNTLLDNSPLLSPPNKPLEEDNEITNEPTNTYKKFHPKKHRKVLPYTSNNNLSTTRSGYESDTDEECDDEKKNSNNNNNNNNNNNIQNQQTSLINDELPNIQENTNETNENDNQKLSYNEVIKKFGGNSRKEVNIEQAKTTAATIATSVFDDERVDIQNEDVLQKLKNNKNTNNDIKTVNYNDNIFSNNINSINYNMSIINNLTSCVNFLIQVQKLKNEVKSGSNAKDKQNTKKSNNIV